MTDLEASTELFDLFGEAITCSICQEDLTDGERVRAVRSCQHAFHANCVDPWLTSKGTCPMCRVSLRESSTSVEPRVTNEIIADANRSIQNMYSTLRNAIQVLPNNGRLYTILEEIDAIIQDRTQTAPLVPQTAPPVPLERYTLAHCLAHGIYRRYRTAALFEPHRNAVRTGLASFALENTQPMPIDSTSFTAIIRSRDSYRDEFIRQRGYTTHNYTSSPEIRTMNERLRSAANAGNQFLAEHWRG